MLSTAHSVDEGKGLKFSLNLFIANPSPNVSLRTDSMLSLHAGLFFLFALNSISVLVLTSWTIRIKTKVLVLFYSLYMLILEVTYPKISQISLFNS